MKFAALGILVIFNFHLLNGQADTASLKLLETLMRNQQPNGILYYTDRLDPLQIAEIKKATNQRYFRGIPLIHNGEKYLQEQNHIYLSRKEKRKMDSTIISWVNYRWEDSLFLHARRISVDSIWNRINQYYSDEREIAKKNNLPNKAFNVPNDYEKLNSFEFTPVIYFRQRTLLLVYIYRICGGECGGFDLAFYKKDKGQWHKLFTVAGAVF